MKEILSGLVWIGNASSRNDLSQLYCRGIEAVVDLASEELPATLGRDQIYCRIPLSDDGSNSQNSITLAIETIVRLLRTETPTMICCSAGLSRSPAITAAALAIAENESPQHCLKRITKDYSFDISTAFWAGVINAVDSFVPENNLRLSYLQYPQTSAFYSPTPPKDARNSLISPAACASP